MSEMVERVAAAIGCLNDSCRNQQECKDCRACLEAARAAIGAMREPTDDMLKAMRAEEEAGGGCWPETFIAAIDAALA